MNFSHKNQFLTLFLVKNADPQTNSVPTTPHVMIPGPDMNSYMYNPATAPVDGAGSQLVEPVFQPYMPPYYYPTPMVSVCLIKCVIKLIKIDVFSHISHIISQHGVMEEHNLLQQLLLKLHALLHYSLTCPTFNHNKEQIYRLSTTKIWVKVPNYHSSEEILKYDSTNIEVHFFLFYFHLSLLSLSFYTLSNQMLIFY